MMPRPSRQERGKGGATLFKRSLMARLKPRPFKTVYAMTPISFDPLTVDAMTPISAGDPLMDSFWNIRWNPAYGPCVSTSDKAGTTCVRRHEGVAA